MVIYHMAMALLQILSGRVLCCMRWWQVGADRNVCFELFGFDILIDDQLMPWLLEVGTYLRALPVSESHTTYDRHTTDPLWHCNMRLG